MSRRSASASVRAIIANQAGGQPDGRVDHAAVYFGDIVTFTVTVTDEQPVDCDRVNVVCILGHQSSNAGGSGGGETAQQGTDGVILRPQRGAAAAWRRLPHLLLRDTLG